MLHSAVRTMRCAWGSPVKSCSPSFMGAPAAARAGTPSGTKEMLATAERAHCATSGERWDSCAARDRETPSSVSVLRKRSSLAKCATACTAAPASSGSASRRAVSWGRAPWAKSVSRARASAAMPATAMAAWVCMTPPVRRSRPTRWREAAGSCVSIELIAPERARLEKASSASWRTAAERCVRSWSSGPRHPLSTMACTCADDADICAMVLTACSAVCSSGERRDSLRSTTPPDSRRTSVDRASPELSSETARMAAERTGPSAEDMSWVSAGMALASRTAACTLAMLCPPPDPRASRSWIALASASADAPAPWLETRLATGLVAPASTRAVAHREERQSSLARARAASRTCDRPRSRPTRCTSAPDSAACVRASPSAAARAVRRATTSSCTAVLGEPREGVRRKATPERATSRAVDSSATHRRVRPPATHSSRLSGHESPPTTCSENAAAAPASTACARRSSSSIMSATARAACVRTSSVDRLEASRATAGLTREGLASASGPR
mmetsp:Transcript_18602/g.58880  ORF Transcript_18602/g.58880 Transcript_18602/m.58880 type:complete len:505 (-) Transcript_18602:994-2508(-)